VNLSENCICKRNQQHKNVELGALRNINNQDLLTGSRRRMLGISKNTWIIILAVLEAECRLAWESWETFTHSPVFPWQSLQLITGMRESLQVALAWEVMSSLIKHSHSLLSLWQRQNLPSKDHQQAIFGWETPLLHTCLMLQLIKPR
jgi:hypothetical protein